MRASVESKITFGFAASVLALGVMGWLSCRTTRTLIAAEDWVSHTHEVLAALESGRATLAEIEMDQRGYLLTGDRRLLQECRAGQLRIGGWMRRLRGLTSDNPAQQQRLNRLQSLISNRLAALNQRIQLRQKQGTLSVSGDVAALRRGEALMHEVWQRLAQVHDAEDQLLQQRQRAARASAGVNLFLILAGSALACVVGLMAVLWIRRDLKLRRRAEETLQQNEERFRLMVENVKDYAIFMLDPAGCVVSWNDGARRIKGYSAGEIIGQHFSRFYPDEIVRAGFPQKVLAEAEARGRFEDEGWRVRKNGSRFWANAVVTAIRDPDGRLLGFVKVMRDLTDRRRVEEELEKNRALLQSILDNTSAVIFLKDLEGRYLFVNRRFAELAGHSQEDIAGKTVFDLFPEDIARAADEHDRAVRQAPEPEPFEEIVQHPDGPHTHLVVKFPARDAAGNVYATGAVSTDITDRKRAEQAREERDRFFDLSRDMICVAGFDGYFKALNPAWKRTLGFSREELLASPFIEFVHPEDRDATQAEAAKLAEGEETVSFENRYLCKDGSYRWLAWSSRAAVPQKLIYATARDITERKRAQAKIIRLNAELQRRARQLEAANGELEAFSYSVSHDLRAPLRHIDGFVKLLDKQAAGKLDDRSRRYLTIIADSARRMGALIDDLLVFSRMGRAELRQTRVSADALVHEALDALQSETEGRRIRWKIGALPEIQADPAMLRQVWINLIANAVKYTRPRDPAEIEIGCQGSANGEPVFFVRDNGVGFDMQYAHKLFGVFQRLHRSDEFEGTGIGLANVSRIVHRHGGRAWAEGNVDRGATFFFSLPQISTDRKG